MTTTSNSLRSGLFTLAAMSARTPPVRKVSYFSGIWSSSGCTFSSLPIDAYEQFVYDEIMDVECRTDAAVSRIAAAIGEPARARMLYCLVDGHARTSTELSMVAEVILPPRAYTWIG